MSGEMIERPDQRGFDESKHVNEHGANPESGTGSFLHWFVFPFAHRPPPVRFPLLIPPASQIRNAPPTVPPEASILSPHFARCTGDGKQSVVSFQASVEPSPSVSDQPIATAPFPQHPNGLTAQ